MNLKGIDVVIFDLDGTLYQLDGDDNTIKNSTLIKIVQNNSIDFVIKREEILREQAEKIIEEAMKDEIGISAFLSRRYGITREEYFRDAWNINPEVVLLNHENTTNIIRRLKKQKKNLILLTAAPAVWRDNVLKYLEITDCFCQLFSGENFRSKQEIFEKLSLDFSPGSILSVGDQYLTDIEPASNLGMRTFEVKNPMDLESLC